jgi:hypothetical protein
MKREILTAIIAIATLSSANALDGKLTYTSDDITHNTTRTDLPPAVIDSTSYYGLINKGYAIVGFDTISEEPDYAARNFYYGSEFVYRACPKYKDPLRHNAFSAEKSEHGSLK